MFSIAFHCIANKNLRKTGAFNFFNSESELIVGFDLPLKNEMQ